MSGIVDLTNFKINSLLCSMDSSNTFRFDFSSDPQYMLSKQQAVLCQIVGESNNKTGETNFKISH